MNLTKNPLFYLSLVLAIIVGLQTWTLVQAAFQEPTSAFPTSDVYAPLDTGPVPQTKYETITARGMDFINDGGTKVQFRVDDDGICLVDNVGQLACRDKWIEIVPLLDLGAGGDITSVTAGNQLTGGGLSGAVTLGVDEGTGSDLDADLLDGQHGAYYLDNTTVDGCSDCLSTTEIADVYVLNTGDSMSGDLTINGTITATAFVGDGAGLTNLLGGGGEWDPVTGGILYDGGNVTMQNGNFIIQREEVTNAAYCSGTLNLPTCVDLLGPGACSSASLVCEWTVFVCLPRGDNPTSCSGMTQTTCSTWSLYGCGWNDATTGIVNKFEVSNVGDVTISGDLTVGGTPLVGWYGYDRIIIKPADFKGTYIYRESLGQSIAISDRCSDEESVIDADDLYCYMSASFIIPAGYKATEFYIYGNGTGFDSNDIGAFRGSITSGSSPDDLGIGSDNMLIDITDVTGNGTTYITIVVIDDQGNRGWVYGGYITLVKT